RVENTQSFITIFPEEVSSRESQLLLGVPHCSALTVGFGFTAAGNPKWPRSWPHKPIVPYKLTLKRACNRLGLQACPTHSRLLLSRSNGMDSPRMVRISKTAGTPKRVSCLSGRSERPDESVAVITGNQVVPDIADIDAVCALQRGGESDRQTLTDCGGYNGIIESCLSDRGRGDGVARAFEWLVYLSPADNGVPGTSDG